MIKFKTPLKYKYYLISNFYRMADSIVDKIFLVFFVLLFFVNILLQNYYLAIISFLIPVFFNLVFSLVKFLYAKLYYKINFMEYFFNKNSFGYTIGEYKIEIQKEKIEYIKANKNCFLIKTLRQKLYFIADKTQLQKIKKELLNSSYKKFF